MNDTLYASGEIPLKGDRIYHQRLKENIGAIPPSKEEQQTWIVTSLCGDMVRCKCDGAENWRQAHYVAQMCLMRRK